MVGRKVPMTALYQGGGKYNLYFKYNLITISEEDISELIEHFTKACEDNIVIPRNDSLENDNELLAKEIDSLQGLLRDAEEENLKLENLLL